MEEDYNILTDIKNISDELELTAEDLSKYALEDEFSFSMDLDKKTLKKWHKQDEKKQQKANKLLTKALKYLPKGTEINTKINEDVQFEWHRNGKKEKVLVSEITFKLE